MRPTGRGCSSPEVLTLLEEARMAELSGGAFDPTIAPAVDLWGFVEGGGRGDSPAPIAGVEPPDPESWHGCSPPSTTVAWRSTRPESECG